MLYTMSAEKKSSYEHSDPARNTGHKVESKRESKQHWTTSVKEKIQSPQGQKSSKFQDNCVVPSGKLQADHQHHGSRQHMNEVHVIRLQPSVTCQKQRHVSKSNKDDELVKYMSNLPGYLQQAEKQKSVQVKALNFGVLDWKRLEKWKSMPAKGQSKESSSSSLSIGSGKRTLSKTSVGGKQSSADLHHESVIEVRSSEDAQKLQGKVKRVQGPQTVSQSNISVHQKDFSRSAKSSCRNYPRTIHDEGKKEPDQIERTFPAASLSFRKQNGESRTLDDDIVESPKRCNAEPQNIVLLKPKCRSKRSSSHFSRLSASSDGQLTRDARDRDSALSSSQEPQSRELSHEFPHFYSLPARVVAREKVSDVCTFPDKSDKSFEPQSSEGRCVHSNIRDDDCPVSADICKGSNNDTAQKRESRASSRQHLANANRNRYSDCFSSLEISCGGVHSEPLHSCPAPTSIAILQGLGSDFCTYLFQNDPSIEPRLSNATCPESKSCNFDDTVSIESLKEMDVAFAKQTAQRGRHPSPNRRFSFSLGRLSRSFSFKESSTFTQSSSIHSTPESGPEKYWVSAAIDDNSKKDKANASGRRRPSPFRRLLDPLLKPKLAHSAEAVQTKGAQSSEDSSFVPLLPNSVNKPLLSETNPASTFEAILQLTVKNGVPFYKFVVDNRSDILAAALKQSPSSKEADRSLTYSIYSVHEIKKKAGAWISNGSKDKNCGFGYNVVGQMKLTRSLLSEFNDEDCTKKFVSTESVLYDANITEGNKGSADVLPGREIAAIILKDPVAKYNNGESKADNSCYLGEKEICNSTTVILPGALHSLPSNGAPSSLIHRWKSGGLCDCGGWDVGCKFKILTDHNQGSNFSTQTRSCSSPEHTNLFVQGGDRKGQPVFRLAPVKDGFYAVEFHSSVSLLEGFAICMAVITSREFADVFDIKPPAEAKLPVEVRAENGEKTKMKLQVEVLAKFLSLPPSSPVGRI